MLLPLLLATAGMAQAHAVARSAMPEDGAILDDPPAEVVVRFSEPVSLVRAQVLDHEGRDVLASEDAEARGDGLHLGLPADLDQGSYTVSYHVVSLDGHPVAGTLVFSLGQVSGGSAGVVTADQGQPWRWAFLAARLAFDLGLLGAAGGVAYTALVRPEGRPRDAAWRTVGASAAVGTLSAILALGLHGGLLLGGPAGGLLDPLTWRTGALSAFGCTALCAVAGLLLVGLAARRRAAAAGVVGILGACLAFGSFTLSGHVVTAGARWLTSPVLLLHVGAAAFWAGSLVPLVAALSRPADEAGLLLRRFSALAVPAVALLILAGAALAWVQVRDPGTLLGTDYGRLLLVKLGLVGGLLGLAALNRVRLTPALVRSEADAVRRLRQSIGAEVALVVAVLAVTGALGTTPPPRALLSLEAAGLHGHAHLAAEAGPRVEMTGLGFRAEVTLDSGQLGSNSATILVRDDQGGPLEAPEVSLRLSNPDRGVVPMERVAQRDGPGAWHVLGLVLGVPGDWTLELDVLVNDFERQSARATVRF